MWTKDSFSDNKVKQNKEEKMDKRDHNMYIQDNNSFFPKKDVKVISKIKPGRYNFIFQNTMSGPVYYFKEMDFVSDKIVDIPSPEYTFITSQMEYFLNTQTRKKFDDMGFIYKRSALLYGKPGTGKSVLVERVAQSVVSSGGIVLFNPDPRTLSVAFQVIDEVQPETTTLVIFEEVDETIARHEGVMLSLLDGEVQKNNVMYLATTNFIEKIPQRIQRPGRFSNVIEVKLPNLEARKAYISTKILDKEEVNLIAKSTENFSIDELKETILSMKCLDMKLDDVIKRVLGNKERFVLENKANDYEE